MENDPIYTRGIGHFSVALQQFSNHNVKMAGDANSTRKGESCWALPRISSFQPRPQITNDSAINIRNSCI